jgi:hypothetical protein
MSSLLAAILYPFVLFVLAVLVLNPIRRSVENHLPEGRLKRLLLLRVN